MPRRWTTVFGGVVVSLLAAGCGGGEDDPEPSAAAPRTTATTQPPIEGVQIYEVQPGHAEGPLTYPQVPPVGGVHNPMWQPCGFYDGPVPNERAVHSLEHGAIWIAYRPDLPVAEVDALAGLARSRKDVLVSRWDEGLPAPVVATAWGRQLHLQSVADPRLPQFVRAYANKGPEPNAPC